MLSPKELADVFYVRDGTLYWKIPTRKTKPGTRAGNVNLGGYVDIRYQGRRYYAHRIVFAMTHGRWPTKFIDHINGQRSDNRPENLREANFAENSTNQKMKKTNTSGIKGLSKHRDGGWNAEVTFEFTRHRKYFRNKNKAIAWLDHMRQTIHGEFANYGDTK